jgi:hypothetical protein
MANDLSGNPWKIDTAAVITTDPVRIHQCVWQEPSASGEDLTIVDNANRIIWDENSLSGGTGVSIEQDLHGLVYSGFNVTVIDSGTLYVYYV